MIYRQRKISSTIRCIQGFTTWKVEVDGVQREFWTTQQYYMSKELLELSSEERVASYDSSKLVQGDAFWVSGLYGKLRNISMTDTGMLKEGFVLNNCIDRMGHHYYYNMTKQLPCTSEMIFPWSPLVMNNTVIGVALNLLVRREEDSSGINYFEKNIEAGIRLTVTTGPECLFAAADDPGIVTLHVYFIPDAYLITCP
ncbi:uncharacterized protein LOC115452771 [Manduca sexta]|uniref:uncharacterized protein LOC115452771 n=1 Tax=Manduca sexta TaxID=7130 RepID=UPI00188E2A8A|nr:uncharacterized protein LOC115452771 [Manduca sexta]